MPQKIKDAVGMKFHKITVLAPTEKRSRKYMVWLCLCDCGNYTEIDTGHLGKTMSCGCLLGNPQPKGQASFTNLFHRYKQNAKERSIEFSLTKEQFKELTRQNCYYCNKIPNQVNAKTRFNGNYTYNGVDRADNSKGYVIENCVTCCGVCNRAKDVMSTDEFLSWLTDVYNNMSLRI